MFTFYEYVLSSLLAVNSSDLWPCFPLWGLGVASHSYELQVHPSLILTANSGVALTLGQWLSHEQIMQITLDGTILKGTNWSHFLLLKVPTDSVDSFSPSQTCLLHSGTPLVRHCVLSFAFTTSNSDQGTIFWVERWRWEANFSPWSALLWRIWRSWGKMFTEVATFRQEDLAPAGLWQMVGTPVAPGAI